MYNLFIRFPYPPYFLGDVRRAIRSKGEQLTREEENLLMKFEDRVVTVYYAGVCVGTVSLWLVFRRLNPTKVHWQAIWKNLTWEPESLRKDDIAKICRLQEKFKFSLNC